MHNLEISFRWAHSGRGFTFLISVCGFRRISCKSKRSQEFGRNIHLAISNALMLKSAFNKPIDIQTYDTNGIIPYLLSKMTNRSFFDYTGQQNKLGVSQRHTSEGYWIRFRNRSVRRPRQPTLSGWRSVHCHFRCSQKRTSWRKTKVSSWVLVLKELKTNLFVWSKQPQWPSDQCERHFSGECRLQYGRSGTKTFFLFIFVIFKFLTFLSFLWCRFWESAEIAWFCLSSDEFKCQAKS